MDTFIFSVVIAIIGTIPYIKGQANICDNYLVSGPNGVPDSNFNASSVYMTKDPKHEYGPQRARLNNTETKTKSGTTLIGAWSAEKLDVNQYIQVELNDPSLIRGVVTQGRHGCCKQWITKYRVLYSMDCKTFTPVGDHNVSDAFFKGNSDEDTPETNMFECPVIAKCIRINPIQWNHHVSLRFDLLGCSLITGGPSQTTQGSGTSTSQSVPVVTTAGGQSVPVVTTGGAAQSTTMAAAQTSMASKGAVQTSGQMTTGSSQSPMTTTGAVQLTTGGNAATTAPASRAPGGKASAKCLKDCKGQPNGDYQSCMGCKVYVTCSNGILYDNRPCPMGLKWVDSQKKCDFDLTKTCP